jgi:hypothetical protein
MQRDNCAGAGGRSLAIGWRCSDTFETPMRRPGGLPTSASVAMIRSGGCGWLWQPPTRLRCQRSAPGIWRRTCFSLDHLEQPNRHMLRQSPCSSHQARPGGASSQLLPRAEQRVHGDVAIIRWSQKALESRSKALQARGALCGHRTNALGRVNQVRVGAQQLRFHTGQSSRFAPFGRLQRAAHPIR